MQKTNRFGLIIKNKKLTKQQGDLFAIALIVAFSIFLVGEQDKLLVPDSDPRVIHIRQQFRQNHDVRYIRGSLPYQSSDIQINRKKILMMSCLHLLRLHTSTDRSR